MTDPATSDDQDLDAGPFSPWLNEVLGAIRGEHGSDVPCNGCTACCTSSQFIHIEPDEDDTLSCIPPELLFPAPRLPRGHVLLGYDEHGHCPMLVDDHCSIYEHRPRTCRTYDCRIFPAAGLTIDESDKVLINRQAQALAVQPPDRGRRPPTRRGQGRGRLSRPASRRLVGWRRWPFRRDPTRSAGDTGSRRVSRE